MTNIGGIEVTSKTFDTLTALQKQQILNAATKEELQVFNFDKSGSIDSKQEIAAYFYTLKARLAVEENEEDNEIPLPFNATEAEAKVFDFHGDGKVDSEIESSAYSYYKEQKAEA